MILWALDGRIEMLKGIFGSSEESDRPKGPITPERFKAFAAEHNRQYAAQRGKRRRRRGG